MIAFNLENKITWEELSPSLQELFKTLQSQIVDLPNVIEKQIERDLTDPSSNFYKTFKSFTQTVINNDLGDPTSNIYKTLTKATTNIINNSTNDPSSDIYKSLQNYINNQIANQLNNSNSSIYNSMTKYMNKYLDEYFGGGTDGSTNGTGYKRIKQLMFTNLPPKIGFLDETTANISGAFNMSATPMYNRAWWITSDIEGREMYYFIGYNEVNTTRKIYRAYRSSLSDTSSFIFDNDPVCPIKLGEDYYMDNIISLTNSYIIAHCTNGSTSHWYKIDTKYSSNVKNWENYKIVDGLVNITGCQAILYFDKWNGTNINRYLVMTCKDNSTYLDIVDSSFNVLSQQEIFNPTNPAPTTSFDNNRAQYSTEYYSHNYPMLTMAFVDDFETDIHRLVVWLPCQSSLAHKDGSGLYAWTIQTAYVDWINFKPTQLLTTSNYFNIPSNWNMGRNLFSNYDKSDIYGGDSTFIFGYGRVNPFISYDSLNKYLYISRNYRDDLGNDITRIPFKNLDWSTKGGNLFSTGNNAWFSLNPPDTSPWAKKHYGPSLIYDGVYLHADSVSRGMKLKNFSSTGPMDTAIIPKATSDAHKVGVTAGTWVVRYYGTWPSGKTKLKTIIDDTQSNCNWYTWNGRYSETKEPFNSTDGCSWYALELDNNNFYVYRINHSNRTDRNGIARDDLLNIDYSNVVCTFARPSGINYNFMPQGCSWAYRSSRFGGRDQLIIYAVTHGNRHCTKNGSGTWVEDDPDAIPYFLIINTDGSYKKLRYNYSSFRDPWFGYVSDSNPYLRYVSICNGSFLEDDGKTFYCNCHFNTTILESYGDLPWKVEFTLDSSNNITGITSINSCSFGCGGQWNGQESLGWSKSLGYFKTAANFSGVSYIYYSRTSMAKAISEENYIYLTNTGTTGLVANLQTTPIYLGGYYSLIPSQEIDLKPNSHNYIYLFRDSSDPDNVIVEVYDKLLGGDDRDIHFARILVADIETDSEGPIHQTSYKTVNYGSGTGLS